MEHSSKMKAMCGVQLKYGGRTKELMLGLNEVIDHLATANSAH